MLFRSRIRTDIAVTLAHKPEVLASVIPASDAKDWKKIGIVVETSIVNAELPTSYKIQLISVLLSFSFICFIIPFFLFFSFIVFLLLVYRKDSSLTIKILENTGKISKK